MRTTVEFAEDTARAVAEVRREQGLGASDAVNAPIRRGLVAGTPDAPRLTPRTAAVGLRIDVSAVAAAPDDLDPLETG